MLELGCQCGHVIFKSNDILKFMDVREKTSECPKCKRKILRDVKNDKCFLDGKETGVIF